MLTQKIDLRVDVAYLERNLSFKKGQQTLFRTKIGQYITNFVRFLIFVVFIRVPSKSGENRLS